MTNPAAPPPVTPARTSFLLLGVMLGLLILAMAGIIVFTYLEAQRTAQYAAAVNLAGRQRMLSQRITKSLFELQIALDEGASPVKPREELRRSAELFDLTLNAFSDGLQTRGTNQELVQLPRLASPGALGAISRGLDVWRPLLEKIRAITTGTAAPAPAVASAAAAYASDVNLSLLGLMDQLTSAVEKESAELGRSLTRTQIFAGLFGALPVVAAILLLIRRARVSDRSIADFTARLQSSNEDLVHSAEQLESAKEETDLILTTVRQGMFLVDPKLQIGAQYSDEMRRLFHIDDLAGMNFLSLLQRLLPEKMFNTTRDYIALLFDAGKKEKQLAKINPLSQVEVNFPNPSGGFDTSFYDFTFRRIVRDKRVTRLFIGIRDITHQVQLEQRLRTEEAKKQRQFEILLSILHVEPAALHEFLQLARGEMGRINDAFKMEDLAHAQGSPAAAGEPFREKLRGVYASIHNVKGNAAALRLSHFEKSAHDFEEQVRALLDRPRLSGEDLLSVVVRQSEFRAALDEAGDLADRVRGAFGAFPARVGEPIRAADPARAVEPAPRDALVETVTSFAADTALKFGRDVQVDLSELRAGDIPAPLRATVRDVLLQLVRNAVVHGIEDPARRTAARKPAHGTIRIGGYPSNPSARTPVFHLHVTDDGAGLDYGLLRERAVTLGLATPAQVRTMADEETTVFIFASGFSTVAETTTDAGRGAGLDFVKRRVVDDCSGDIEVVCKPGRSLRFNIALPVPGAAAPLPLPTVNHHHEAAHR